MRLLRGLLGALLWILAGLLALVSLLLCVTIILLPLGIPLFRVSSRCSASQCDLLPPLSLIRSRKPDEGSQGHARSRRDRPSGEVQEEGWEESSQGDGSSTQVVRLTAVQRASSTSTSRPGQVARLHGPGTTSAVGEFRAVQLTARVHIHRANLGFRLDDYRAAGAGGRVCTSTPIRHVVDPSRGRAPAAAGLDVVTSGHLEERVAGGLSGYLRTIAARRPPGVLDAG